MNITLKNVPPEVHAELKAAAKRNGRSMNQEAIWRLGHIAADDIRLRSVRESKTPNSGNQKPSFEVLVQEAKDRGPKQPLTSDQIVQWIHEGREE